MLYKVRKSLPVSREEAAALINCSSLVSMDTLLHESLRLPLKGGAFIFTKSVYFMILNLPITGSSFALPFIAFMMPIIDIIMKTIFTRPSIIISNE